MARMTRTQITLEEAEYHFLKARAAETGASFSSLIRELVRERMERVAASSPPVWAVAGLVTESGFSGKDHDTVLYGEPTSPGRPGDAEPPDLW